MKTARQDRVGAAGSACWAMYDWANSATRRRSSPPFPVYYIRAGSGLEKEVAARASPGRRPSRS